MILKPVTVKQRCHLHNDPQPDRAVAVAMAVGRQAEEWRQGSVDGRRGGLQEGGRGEGAGLMAARNCSGLILRKAASDADRLLSF